MVGLIEFCMVKQKLDEKAFGLAIGVLVGAYMFLLGLTTTFLGMGGDMMRIMGSWYIGFGPTPVGAIIGAVWGLVDGFIFGWVAAYLYNYFVK